MEKGNIMPSDEETFFKIISQRLDQISMTLDKLNTKFDQSQNEMHQINLKVQDLEISKKYLAIDIDALKVQVSTLKEFSNKMTVLVGIGSFAISVLVTLLTKIFVH